MSIFYKLASCCITHRIKPTVHRPTGPQAFDSIDHKFLFNTLDTLGFGKDIIGWIKLFFNNRKAQILMSGHLTDTINLEQGVPQGDVISPYLFILMVKVLLIKINHTKNLAGIKYATHKARSETFARNHRPQGNHV